MAVKLPFAQATAKSKQIASLVKRLTLDHWRVTITALALLGYGLSIAIFYPGYMSGDSLAQYGQAIGAYELDDWHPIITIFVWKVLLLITGDSIGSMLLFQLFLLWSAIALFSLCIYGVSRSRKLSLVPIILFALPYVCGIAGVLWKDVQMAYALLLAVALCISINVYARQISTRTKWFLGTIVVGLLVYAVLLRYNAVFAVVPLIFLWAHAMELKQGRYIAFAAVGILLCVAGAQAVLNSVLSPRSSHPLSSVMLDDVVNLATAEDVRSSNIAPPLKETILSVKNCSTEDKYLNLYLVCTTASDRTHVSSTHYTDMQAIWLTTLVHNVPQYAVYRVQSFAWFLFAPGGVYSWQPGVNDNTFGVQEAQPRMGKALGYYVNDFAAKKLSFLFEAWFWLTVSVALFVYAARQRAKNQLVLVLSASAALYILFYYPVVVATDYRYVYWPALACTVAAVFVWVNKNLRS
jgi:hypothetical protein